MIHELPKLNYEYNSLEPFIDAMTMEIHYSKHHQAYINKLNDALKNYPDLQLKTLAEIIISLNAIPSKIRKIVKNNAGGHFNHSFFWSVMKPNSGGEPKGGVAEAIKSKFKNFDKFKVKFNADANGLFGSGWTWLVVDKKGDIKIISTSGHDNPISKVYIPLLVIDVWEHAYYLKYQNKRDEYIDNWFNVINWEKVNDLYLE